MKKQKKTNKGITLIALVITIIILLILAGITIGMLTGENGILTKASQAEEETKKASYKELVEIIILEKQMERSYTKPFIKVVADAIDEKEWSKTVTIYDEYGKSVDTEEELKNCNKIIVETKDGYEIIVDIDNENNTGKVISVTKGIGKKYKITFDANFDGNEGEGDVPEEIESRQGFYAILPSGESLRQSGKKIVGWSEDPKAKDTDTSVYACGSAYQPSKEETTLYAVWAENTIKISFNANGGYGEMNSIDVLAGKDTKLPKNLFEREGWNFKEWNTKSDGNGTSYAEGDSVTFSTDTFLYVMWEEQIDLQLVVPLAQLSKDTQIKMTATSIASGIKKMELKMGNKVLYTQQGDEKQTFSTTCEPTQLNKENLDFGSELQLVLEVTSTMGTVKSVSEVVTSYCIGNYEAFMKFAKSVNAGTTYEGKNIYLINNVTTERRWIPAGYVDNIDNPSGAYFGGNFYGEGHIIYFDTPYFDSQKDRKGYIWIC